jgi:hypothetical protein
MKNKELFERITKIKSDIVREMFTESYNKMNYKERQKLAKILNSFEDSLKNDLNFKAKAIAAYIRMYMEDFHCQHLSNEQMKELNPIIRNAIYTFLVDENDGDTMDISSVCRLNLPSYWEDCEYLRKIV